MPFKIGITRFNNKTWKEYTNYRTKHNISGAIYGTSILINSEIHDNYNIYVLEMNNDTNTIMGISIIKSIVYPKKKIYSQGEYNRYIYKGEYRIDKKHLKGLELKLIERFEELVFKGCCHMKRGSGITILPTRIYTHTKLNDNGVNVIRFLENLFRH